MVFFEPVLSVLVHEPVEVLLKVLILPIHYAEVNTFVVLGNLHI